MACEVVLICGAAGFVTVFVTPAIFTNLMHPELAVANACPGAQAEKGKSFAPDREKKKKIRATLPTSEKGHMPHAFLCDSACQETSGPGTPNLSD